MCRARDQVVGGSVGRRGIRRCNFIGPRGRSVLIWINARRERLLGVVFNRLGGLCLSADVRAAAKAPWRGQATSKRAREGAPR